MKNKLVVLLFRLSLIGAGVMGLAYVIKFFILGSTISTMDTVEGFASLRTWSKIFFIYEVLCIVSLILSGVTFPATGKVKSVIRTIVIAFAVASDLLAHKYISIFSSTEDALEGIDEFQDIADNGLTKVVLSFAGACMLGILVITSIVAVVRKFKE